MDRLAAIANDQIHLEIEKIAKICLATHRGHEIRRACFDKQIHVTAALGIVRPGAKESDFRTFAVAARDYRSRPPRQFFRNSHDIYP